MSSSEAPASSLVHRSPVYYGWIVLGISTLGMAATLPGQTAGVSLFIDAFIEDLELSRSAVSWFYTVATVLGSLALPLVGRLLDRYGPRRVAVVIIACFAASCAGMGWVSGWIGVCTSMGLVWWGSPPGTTGDRTPIGPADSVFIRRVWHAGGWPSRGVATLASSEPGCPPPGPPRATVHRVRNSLSSPRSIPGRPSAMLKTGRPQSQVSPFPRDPPMDSMDARPLPPRDEMY